ncbi:hypothetical protein Tco_0674330 [Tanacetum coccineum]
MWTYGITYNVPILYKYNINNVFQSASKAEDVFEVLLVLKLVLQLGSSLSLLVQEPLYLELHEELEQGSQYVFLLSNLKKCYADEPLAIPLDGLHVDDKLQFVEEPVEIMDREVKQLRQSRVPIVKIQSCRILRIPWPPAIFCDVPGPEYPPSPDFVPEPVYPEFMPPEDEILPAEEQPLPAAASPTADSPGYVSESDPEEDPEEDDDKDPEEDPTDYPAVGGDDDDDEDESSDDEEDDDVDIKEEEEHPTPADSIVVALPAVDQAPSAKETGPDETPISLPPREEVERLLAMPTPPSSPLSPWSSPLPQIPSPPLPPILSPLPDEMLVDMPGAPATDDTEMGRRMTEFTTRVRQDTNEIYTRDAGGISQEAEAAHRGTEADKETLDSEGRVRETAGTSQRSCTARAIGGGW